MKRKPLAFCHIVFYIHVLLLIIAVCLATVAVSLAYHPKSPRLSVTSATLNAAAHIDKRGDGARRAISANLTVLAAISNPNTKIGIVLRYVRFDLYFEGSVIAAQAVWPAPVQVAPGGSVLRRAHLVVSNVSVTRQDANLWRNATAKGGGPVALRLGPAPHAAQLRPVVLQVQILGQAAVHALARPAAERRTATLAVLTVLLLIDCISRVY
uniref:Late embryogenesis abundant protein LEA-2 subgroup domain-containing protein n=1 Tax=Oryza meridionalis TaxID=40149 RepID=A0A0E0CBW5_9ORYZ